MIYVFKTSSRYFHKSGKVIRSTVVLTRILTHLDFSWEEDAVRYYWTWIVHGHVTEAELLKLQESGHVDDVVGLVLDVGLV